jgi:quinol monooxygenase YgiN
MQSSVGVVVIIDLRTKPEHAASVKALLHGALPDILGFDGCLSAALHVNQDDNANLMLIERWTSREHFEKYRAWRAARGDHANLVSMLVGPLMVRAFNVVE